MCITGGRVYLPTGYATSYRRREEGRAEEPEDHRYEHPKHLASGRARIAKQETRTYTITWVTIAITASAIVMNINSIIPARIVQEEQKMR